MICAKMETEGKHFYTSGWNPAFGLAFLDYMQVALLISTHDGARRALAHVPQAFSLPEHLVTLLRCGAVDQASDE